MFLMAGARFKRIFAQCDEYGIAHSEFIEIGDMLRANFYRPSYQKNGDKLQASDSCIVKRKQRIAFFGYCFVYWFETITCKGLSF